MCYAFRAYSAVQDVDNLWKQLWRYERNEAIGYFLFLTSALGMG